jgi:hypothetical protein
MLTESSQEKRPRRWELQKTSSANVKVGELLSKLNWCHILISCFLRDHQNIFIAMFDISAEEPLKKTRLAINRALLLGEGVKSCTERADKLKSLIEDIIGLAESNDLSIEMLTTERFNEVATSAAAVNQALANIPGFVINARKRVRDNNESESGESSG